MSQIPSPPRGPRRHGRFIMTVPPHFRDDSLREPLRRRYFTVKLYQTQPVSLPPLSDKQDNPRNVVVKAISGELKKAFDAHIREVRKVYPDFLLNLWVEYVDWNMPTNVTKILGFPQTWNLPLGTAEDFFKPLKTAISQSFLDKDLTGVDEHYDKLEFRTKVQGNPPSLSFELIFEGKATATPKEKRSGFDLAFAVGFTIMEKDEGHAETNYSCLGLTTEDSIMERTIDLGTSCSLTSLAPSQDGSFPSIFDGYGTAASVAGGAGLQFPPKDGETATLCGTDASMNGGDQEVGSKSDN